MGLLFGQNTKPPHSNMDQSPEETSGAGANVQSFNLLDKIKELGRGVLKGATTDLVGAPVDIINEVVGAVSGGRLKSQEPAGGSKSLRRLLVGAGEVEDKSIFETAGTMVNPETAVKSMIIAAARIPNRIAAREKFLKSTNFVADEATIFDKSGVYMDKDRILKTIISDKDARIDSTLLIDAYKNPQNYPLLTLDDVLYNHKELYDLYPELRGVSVTPVSGVNYHGSFNPILGEMEINIDRLKWDPAEVRSTVLHEVQHGIQSIEGFARGSNVEAHNVRTEAQLRALQKKLAEAEKKAKTPAEIEAVERFRTRINMDTREAFNRYRNVAGEQEARFTQQTADMDMAEASNFLLNRLRKGDTPQTWDTVPIRPVP